jgi:hypothetical protein
VKPLGTPVRQLWRDCRAGFFVAATPLVGGSYRRAAGHVICEPAALFGLPAFDGKADSLGSKRLFVCEPACEDDVASVGV